MFYISEQTDINGNHPVTGEPRWHAQAWGIGSSIQDAITCAANNVLDECSELMGEEVCNGTPMQILAWYVQTSGAVLELRCGAPKVQKDGIDLYLLP
jgi:hypothetical protein